MKFKFLIILGSFLLGSFSANAQLVLNNAAMQAALSNNAASAFVSGNSFNVINIGVFLGALNDRNCAPAGVSGQNFDIYYNPNKVGCVKRNQVGIKDFAIVNFPSNSSFLCKSGTPLHVCHATEYLIKNDILAAVTVYNERGSPTLATSNWTVTPAANASSPNWNSTTLSETLVDSAVNGTL